MGIGGSFGGSEGGLCGVFGRFLGAAKQRQWALAVSGLGGIAKKMGPREVLRGLLGDLCGSEGDPCRVLSFFLGGPQQRQWALALCGARPDGESLKSHENRSGCRASCHEARGCSAEHS